MNNKFVLQDLKEDEENLIIYIKEINKEENSSKYISGMYLESNEKNLFLCNLNYYSDILVGKIKKDYLKEISQYNNKESMKFKIKLDFYSNELFLGINYSKQLICWQWQENGFEIICNDGEISLINNKEAILLDESEITGEYYPEDEQHGQVEIKGVELRKNLKNIPLTSRIWIQSMNRSYTLILIDRKSKQSIELNKAIIDEQLNKIIFKMTCKEVELLSYSTGVWNVYIKLKINQKEHMLRVKSNNINILPQLMVTEENKFHQIRAYTTQDQYLGFIADECEPVSSVKGVYFDNNKIIINGDIQILNYDKKLSIIAAKIRKIDCELLSIKDINQENSNCLNNFRIVIDFNEIEESKLIIEGYYYITLILDVYGKRKEYNLEFNSDCIIKEDCIVYPSIDIVNYKYPLSITPVYENMNLMIKIDNLFTIDFIKGSLKGKKLQIICKQNIGHNLKNIQSNLILINENNEEIIVLEDIIQDQKDLIYNIPIESLEKLKLGDMYKFYIKLFNDKFEISKEIIIEDEKFTINKRLLYINASLLIKQGIILLLYKNKDRLVIRKENILTNGKVLKVKYKIANLLAKLLRNFIKRPIWLVGENLAEIAQDNGFAFFEYCMKNNGKEKVCYVSTKHNKNMDNLLPYSKYVVRYNSFKHLLYYNLSQYLIVSHGIKDVMPTILHNQIKNNNKEIIYLQHGIIAMKKLYFNKDSYNGKIRKFIVTSEREKQILINKMNFNENQIVITGLARFDKLKDVSKKNNNRVMLVMPTWREWIVDNKETFTESSFYKRYISLLNNEMLHNLLEKNNITLKFYPHIEIQKKYSHLFNDIHKNISIVKLGEETVQSLIKEASIMITDYSSVALDFNYLKKPCIFYHFDLEEYMYHRGSFIDLERELPGDTCRTEQELLDSLMKYISVDFEYDVKYLDKSKEFYNYNDNNNCQRIYNQIKKL